MNSANKNNNNAPDSNNNNKNAVLDTSALMALFLGEINAEYASEILDYACVSSVTVCEILTEFQQEGGDAQAMLMQLQKLNLDIRPFDAEQAEFAIDLLSVENGEQLHFSDRAALALAMSMKVQVYSQSPYLKHLDIAVKVIPI